MNLKENPAVDGIDKDGMARRVDFSKAVRANTAYRFGEDPQDELQVQRFWQAVGVEAELIAEPGNGRSTAPDFSLKRGGIAQAVCEVKSMSGIDFTVTLIHEDGTETTTGQRWPESNSDRVIRLANRAMEQLSHWNRDRALANIFVFVNRDANVRWEEVQSRLLELSGIDATFWFECKTELIDSKPVVIASEAGELVLMHRLGLTLDARHELTSAA